MDKINTGLGKTGQFMRDNKELVNMAGGALNSMYGPQAEFVDLRRQEMKQRQSLLDRAYRNLNDPVVLQPRLAGAQ